MKKREIFSLAAGVLGFIVDAIALSVFIAQRSFRGPHQGAGYFSRTWGILLLIYGWFLVSWTLSQWRLNRKAANLSPLAGKDATPASHIIMTAVVSIGILLLPIAFMIASDFLRDFQGSMPSESLGFEYLSDLVLLSLVPMSAAGVVVFGATYGLLGIINNEEEFNL
jgi:hypothetical protein